MITQTTTEHQTINEKLDVTIDEINATRIAHEKHTAKTKLVLERMVILGCAVILALIIGGIIFFLYVFAHFLLKTW